MTATSDRPEQLQAVDAGLYTRDIPANTLYADAALAQLFGMDPIETAAGIPLERYLERVHHADRSMLARSIRTALTEGVPFQESYRVYGANGAVNHVMAYGKTFLDAEGAPYRYAGIVFPMPVQGEAENKLLWHCLCAYELAKVEGRTDVVSQIRQVLLNLDWSGAQADCQLGS